MVNPPLVDCSIFLLSNTARAPESAPAPFNGTSIGCSLCCLLSNSQMCLTKPHWATGSSGGVASPSVHQQPTLLRHPWVWPVATTAGSWTVRVCQTEGEEKAVRCLPDLTGPPRGTQALQVDSRAIAGSTSKVKLDVRRRGPGARGTQKTEVPVSAVKQAVLEALPGSGGAGAASPPGPPTLFVNLDCKSNTVVFFTLADWVSP